MITVNPLLDNNRRYIHAYTFCVLADTCLIIKEVRRVRSRRDGQEWVLARRVSCSSRDPVYYILCPCGHMSDYVGSTNDMKARWSGHKSDIRHGRWTACGLTRHFGQHHQADRDEAISNLRVTLLDRLTGPHRRKLWLFLNLVISC